MKLENMAYTVLESSTDSIFLHVTTNSMAGSEWGSLVKSNSNGTYYAMSQEHVNRNSKGYVDFEKMIGLDGVALINIVGNPDDAALSGSKKLQTRITHNDGKLKLVVARNTRKRLINLSRRHVVSGHTSSQG